MVDDGKIQVGKGYYARSSYNNLERFVSYYYQADIALKLGVKNILEIGAGSKIVASYLSSAGIKVTTCDFDRNVNPDIVSDVRKISSPDKSYDAVLAFQILEHVPFKDFDLALSELARVSRKYAIISLPYRSTCAELAFKFPGIRTLFKRNFLDLSVRLPLRFGGFETSGQHYWEIDRRKYKLKIVRKEIEKHFTIREEFSPVLNKFHYFFVLEVK